MADAKRIERMIEILNLIDKGEKLTPEGLAEHFGVKDRTIYRDIAALREANFPIEFIEEKGSYGFVEGYSIKKLDLSRNEVKALLASKAVFSKLGEDFSGAYEGLLSRLKTEAGNKTNQRLKTIQPNYWFDIDPVDDFSAVKKQFDAIQKALDENITLQIRYIGMHNEKETVRNIDPYGLFYSSGVWYTLAHCHVRRKVIVFALDCIKEINVTDRYYAIPSDFSMDKYFEPGWHIMGDGKPVEIRLRFTKEVARWITRRKWHPTQKVEKNKDGSILFAVTLSGTEEIRRWIYHWGPNCEVLSPSEFRKEVAKELKAMAGLYKLPPTIFTTP